MEGKVIRDQEKRTKDAHCEVEFRDGLCGIAFYDKILDDVIRILARLDRKVKEIKCVD